MEKENNLVQVETEDGKVLNLLILKEFEHKKKKYAILTELDCSCDDDCDCKECNCGDECDCKNGGECTCGNECECEDSVFILEITKDEKGNEIFKSIDDDKLFDEIVDKADELLN